MKERNKKMRKIRKLINVALLLVVVCLLGACGKSASSKQTSDVNESFDTYDNENNSSDTFDVENQEKPEEAEETVEIREAVPFSDGLAWIQLANEDNWNCIDVEGNILFEKEGWPDKFVNGYAVVGNSIVIDAEGNDLYDFGSEGYELVDSRALDVGCVILQKDIDTYDKSGTFLYVLDAGEKKITEIDFSDCAYFTTNSWGQNYKKWNNEVRLCDYLGKGYYTLELTDGYEDSGLSSNFRMIQWYDIKNNKYVNIDTGIDYGDEELPDTTIYYKTSNSNIYCIYKVHINKIYFINIDTCAIEDVVDGYIACYGYDYNLVNVLPEDYLLKCYDDRDDETGWFLDMNSREKFTMQPEYKDYEILSYNGDYFCISLINDVGTNYLAVVDKAGNTVYDPIEYASEADFKPCFWGNDFIFYNGKEMCFVNTASWKIENQVVMDIGNSDDEDALWKRMCLMDANSPEVKYVVDFDTGSYYLPNGSEVAAETDNYPTVISSGVFESKLLVWHNSSQNYQFLNNDLTPFQINFK